MTEQNLPSHFGYMPTPFLLYSGDNEDVRVKLLIRDETIWLSLAEMAQLFDVQKPAISKHLKNIYETGELAKESTVSNMETVQIEGGREVKRLIEFYNLDAVIAVGYRVHS